jgi:hypothetical protein
MCSQNEVTIQRIAFTRRGTGACIGSIPEVPQEKFVNFNAKGRREDVFIPTVGNESLHVINNDNGGIVVKFATSKNLSRVKCFHIATLINTFGLILMAKQHPG